MKSPAGFLAARLNQDDQPAKKILGLSHKVKEMPSFGAFSVLRIRKSSGPGVSSALTVSDERPSFRRYFAASTFPEKLGLVSFPHINLLKVV
jgi:hypothetical protein